MKTGNEKLAQDIRQGAYKIADGVYKVGETVGTLTGAAVEGIAEGVAESFKANSNAPAKSPQAGSSYKHSISSTGSSATSSNTSYWQTYYQKAAPENMYDCEVTGISSSISLYPGHTLYISQDDDIVVVDNRFNRVGVISVPTGKSINFDVTNGATYIGSSLNKVEL